VKCIPPRISSMHLKEGLLREVLIMAHIKIGKKIAKYRVQSLKQRSLRRPKTRQKPQDNVIWMHEKLERPEVLIGSKPIK